MKVSFISTVYNEQRTIEVFVNSILTQTKKPDEIIFTDGGSTDNTVKKIKQLRLESKGFKGEFIVLTKKGNRSVGRNEAVLHATGDIIVCADAGNVLDKNWVRNITEPFKDRRVDVVAGYYQGVAKNTFQKCVIPYALVMPDKVNPRTFLPATRSVAFTKKIWQTVGGFREKLSHNEDYAFAKALQKAHAKIVFKKDAIVYWMPRTTFKEAFIMMYRFAYGDAEARIWRPKVIFLFVRYLIGLLLFITAIVIQSVSLFLIFAVLVAVYTLWAVWKNYRYINELQAVFFLPLLQLTADWAVLQGTVLGLFRSKIRYN